MQRRLLKSRKPCNFCSDGMPLKTSHSVITEKNNGILSFTACLTNSMTIGSLARMAMAIFVSSKYP